MKQYGNDGTIKGMRNGNLTIKRNKNYLRNERGWDLEGGQGADGDKMRTRMRI